MSGRKRAGYAAVLCAVALCSALLFYLCWRYDNKYTLPAHPAGQGITVLDMERYRAEPFFYPIQGWELYQNRLLAPAMLAGGAHTPDRHVYLGQYGGFDLGDPGASVGGTGTYRMTVFTDGIDREYALELTEIFTAWRLWVNGELFQCVGMEPPVGEVPQPGGAMVTFRARDTVEIVVEVEDRGGFYGGMVYPPGFGSPEAVARIQQGRLLIHGAACAVALLLGLLCLFIGGTMGSARARPLAVGGSAQPYMGLFLLCVCFCLCIAYPIYQALGLRSGWLTALEQFCYYGMYLVIVWLQGRLCGLRGRWCLPLYVAGAAVCLGAWLPVQALVTKAGGLFLYSRLLTGYIWLVAAWLLVTSAWAVWRGRRYSKPLLAGFIIFAAALVSDRLRTLHEPILLGWNVEIAGFFLILVIAGILWWETARVHRESIRLQEQKRLDDVQLAARREHAALQQDYLAHTRKQLHETRNHMMLLRHYSSLGESGKAREYLDRLLAEMEHSPATLTGHMLIDAILGVQIGRAGRAGIYVEHELGRIPAEIAIADDDLTAVLMNLLDNAIEGCGRLTGGAARWISLQLWYDAAGLTVECINAAPADTGLATSKADGAAHGFGLQVLRETAERYHGALEITRAPDSFAAVVRLQPDTIAENIQHALL